MVIIEEEKAACLQCFCLPYCFRLGSELIKGFKMRLSSIIAYLNKDILGWSPIIRPAKTLQLVQQLFQSIA